MTTDMMNFRDLVEKTPDADLLREMIGFAAERPMELEVGAETGAAYGEKDRHGGRRGTATETGIGRRAQGRSNCASRSSERAATFRHQPARRGFLIKQARTEYHGDDQRQLHHFMGRYHCSVPASGGSGRG